MKGEGTVLPKTGKSFDPVLVPNAIRGAGFTPVEVTVTADGTLASKNGGLELVVPSLKNSFLLAGGPQIDTLKKRRDLVGKKIRLTGKLSSSQANHPPSLSVENFKEEP